MNAKPTPGPISREGLFFYQLDGHPKAQANLWSCSFQPNNGHDKSWANAVADLFHEAGTVHNELGLTPRQLADALTAKNAYIAAAGETLTRMEKQRVELLAALEKFVNDPPEHLSAEWFELCDKARAAIAKCKP